MGIPTTPGAIIGYRSNGRPIHLIAGGDGTEDQGTSGEGQAPEPAGDAQAQQPPADAAKESQEKDGGKAAPEKVEDLPEWAQRDIAKARKGEGDYRTKLREQEQLTQQQQEQHQAVLDAIAKAAGLKEENASPDPEELTKQLTEAQKREQEREAENRTLRLEREAEKVARKHSGDIDTLMDSRSFADKLSKLDPSAEGFASDLDELVKETVESNPKYKAASPAPASSSGDFSSGPGEQRTTHSKGLYAAFKNAYGG